MAIHTIDIDSRNSFHLDMSALDAFEVRKSLLVLHICSKEPISLQFDSGPAAKRAADELLKAWKE